MSFSNFLQNIVLNKDNLVNLANPKPPNSSNTQFLEPNSSLSIDYSKKADYFQFKEFSVNNKGDIEENESPKQIAKMRESLVVTPFKLDDLEEFIESKEKFFNFLFNFFYIFSTFY